MQAVGRLGSYISRSVNTVSGPFHPFGGAVDVVVVEQKDGSFKSSPWYVRFGKFQGVLKAKERMVNISVNGAEADFHMYLDHKGEAFFITEMDAEDGESILYPSSSSDETDSQPQDNKRPLKSESCNFETDKLNSVAHVDIDNGKLLARTNSRRSRLLGFVFNRRSMKGDNGIRKEVELNRIDSLERAEIAANLLELKWSTNLADCKPARKNSIKTRQSLPFQDNTENAWDQCKLSEEVCSCSKREGIGCSKSEFEGIGEEERTSPSCLSSQDEGVENFVAGESFIEGNTKVRAEVSAIGDDDNKDTEVNPNGKKVACDSTSSDLQVACVKLETHFEKQLSGEEVSGISGEDFSANGDGSFVYCKTSERSMMGTDCSTDQTHEVFYLSSRGCEGQQVYVQAEILHATTVILPEVTRSEEDVKNVDLGMPVVTSDFHSQETDFFHYGVSNNGMTNATDPTMMPNPQIFDLDPQLCSHDQAQSNCVAATSCYSCLDNQVLDENKKETEDSRILSPPLVSIGDCVLSNASSKPPSEEEHTHSIDIDKCQITDHCNGSMSPDFVGNDHISYVDSIEKVNQVDDANCDSHSSPESSTTKTHMDDFQEFSQTSPIVIPRNKAAREEVGLLAGSLPKMSSHRDSLNKHDVFHPLSQSLDSKSKSLKLTSPAKNYLQRIKSEGDKENPLLDEELGDMKDHSFTEFKSTVLNPPIGDPSRLNPSPGRNWGLWPFSFRRSGSGKAEQPAPSDAKTTTSGDASECTMVADAEKNELKSSPRRKKVRTKTPTSEQLASLNLKKGRNTVTFTFSTDMLGKQQVDAQIYLWKWNTRIVISDVDGTITRSDVLGQFMPLVGVDWSQTGVAHLYSAIKENDYQLLFLSARAISQAYHTRQFLFNLKQNGKVLPDGPVLISPDGLFPSLYREVIRRAPHEFKIACLEDIKALFPSDCNPFYAGFGNRNTDVISYLKVGIPKGKIFIINPKGEIAVNHYLDTKSYTSLHALVNGMFPATNSSEQEDFNSWNFWKLPPAIDI